MTSLQLMIHRSLKLHTTLPPSMEPRASTRMLSAQVPTFHVDCGTALTAVVRRMAAKNFILLVSEAIPVL
jgi:hypothetical protein